MCCNNYSIIILILIPQSKNKHIEQIKIYLKHIRGQGAIPSDGGKIGAIDRFYKIKTILKNNII